jgi:hypothetical protein
MKCRAAAISSTVMTHGCECSFFVVFTLEALVPSWAWNQAVRSVASLALRRSSLLSCEKEEKDVEKV